MAKHNGKPLFKPGVLERNTQHDAATETLPASQRIEYTQADPRAERETHLAHIRTALDALTRALDRIPYRVFGSTAHFLHDPAYFAYPKKAPEDIDIAIQNADDLMYLFRKLSDETRTHTSGVTIVCEPLRRITSRSAMFSGAVVGEDWKIPFEFFANTEIIPKETWKQGGVRKGDVTILSGEDLRKQYAEVAKIEARVWQDTVHVVEQLLEKTRTAGDAIEHPDHEQERRDTWAKELVDALAKQSPLSRDEITTRIAPVLDALERLSDLERAEPREDISLLKRTAINTIAETLFSMKTGKNRERTLEELGRGYEVVTAP